MKRQILSLRLRSVQIVILILFLVVGMAVSGCLPRQQASNKNQQQPALSNLEGENNTVVENNQGQNQGEIKNLKEEVFEHPEKFEAEITFNEEVDVNNWIYYENEVYSLYYPTELELIKNPLNGERENWFKYSIDEVEPDIYIYIDDFNEARFDRDKKLKIDSKREIKIVELNGYKGWYTEGINDIDLDLSGRGMFFIINNKIVTIGLSRENIDNQIVKTFNQIMSTIKFK